MIRKWIGGILRRIKRLRTEFWDLNINYVFIMVFFAGLLFLIIGKAEWELIIGWLIIVPVSIGLYASSFYYFIPRVLGRRRPFRAYMLSVLLVMLGAVIPVGVFAVALTNGDDAAMSYTTFNFFFQLTATAPLSWWLYKRQMRGAEQLNVLKKELGQSTAHFDFLRSQINPHFLFNALNTIYGTAIQENAERTSEGIEKLGQMMRFMLRENLQEKIALSREIEYLNNYISLQRLRTDAVPNVAIRTEIQEETGYLQITPMLLIPFVENAFKHGISFREPSHINITLEIRDRILYFVVYNSKHPRPENDPEKDKSGIGLNNVQQRLQLLYPGRHELIIRETSKEFFVHLSVQLH